MKTFLITLAALSLTLMSCNSQKQKTVTLGHTLFSDTTFVIRENS